MAIEIIDSVAKRSRFGVPSIEVRMQCDCGNTMTITDWDAFTIEQAEGDALAVAECDCGGHDERMRENEIESHLEDEADERRRAL